VGKLTGAGMSPHDIYIYLKNGPGTGRLDEAQATARVEWTKEDERAELIRKQAEMIRGGWQGSAAEGAFGAAQPLVKSALDGVDKLSSAEDLLDRQSGSFHRAANSVKPVPPEPPKLDMFEAMVAFSDYEKDVKSYQADAQHNIDVFRGYDNASEYNQTNIPKQYTIVSHSGGNISVTQDDGQRDDTGTYIDSVEYQQPRNGSETGTPGGPGSPGDTPAGGSPVGGSPVGGPASNTQQPQLTSPSDFVPPSVNTPTPLPPSTVQPAPTGFTPGGLAPGLPVGGFPGGGTSGPGARGGGSPGAGGRGAPGAGVRGLGAGSGVGALAAEEQAAARRAAAAAAARGGSGAMGGAPMGAGRGKGDEDEEHQRKVLIEIDAEGLFGSDVLTAPQVIGDDDYEDD
jgi:hypothetical protein